MNRKDHSKTNSSDDELYIVDGIEGSRIGPNGEYEYYIKWESQGEPQYTWEPASNFSRLNDFREERQMYLKKWSNLFKKEFIDLVSKRYIHEGFRECEY